MLLSSICKINIGLHILSKRSDGYHTLESVFVPCRWSDCIEIVESPSQNKDIELITSGLKIDLDPQNNSIYKVIQSLRKRYLLPNLYIHLHKQVPMGAGLGGGSSNAARVLQYLKRAYLSKLSDREALEILAQIGSDCRFFWNPKPCIIKGTGNEQKLIPLNLNGYYLAVVYPNIHVSTAWAYQNCQPKIPLVTLETLIKNPVNEWKDCIINDFEPLVFSVHPSLQKIKEKLYQLNALYASMSGSGSAVYGIFKSAPDLSFFSEYKTHLECMHENEVDF